MTNDPRLRLHILGSGCASPTPERYGRAFILEVGGDAVMVDCGPATTYKMARLGLAPGRVHHLFLTHHHFDHNADVPCFVLTRWDMSRGPEPALRVHGPPPTAAFMHALFADDGAFAPDWKSRVEHPASHECHRQRGGVFPRPPPKIQANDVGPGRIAAGAGWTATAARVQHVEPSLESLAFRFDTEQASVVFAGDCGDCAALRDVARDADTLVIACTHFGRAETSAALADVITGTVEAAEIANDAGVRQLVLTHASPNFREPGVRERAIADVARSFQGAILFPDELTTVTVPC